MLEGKPGDVNWQLASADFSYSPGSSGQGSFSIPVLAGEVTIGHRAWTGAACECKCRTAILKERSAPCHRSGDFHVRRELVMLSGVALKISHCIIGSSRTGLRAIFWVTEYVSSASMILYNPFQQLIFKNANFFLFFFFRRHFPAINSGRDSGPRKGLNEALLLNPTTAVNIQSEQLPDHDVKAEKQLPNVH